MARKLGHGLRVAARSGAATGAIALAAYAIAPSLAVLAAIAAATAVIAFELSRVKLSIDRQLEGLAWDVAQAEPRIALAEQLPMRAPLAPMRGYAIAPDFALVLAELIAERRPELVVETGSGVSTIVIAYALEKLGRGRLISLDHDATYAAKTRAELARHGLERFATVVHAPLEPIEIDGERYRWHARDALAGVEAIDLVVDDGPPRYLGDMLRYASLPELGRRLRADGVFVIDAIGDEETQILARWRRRFPEFAQAPIETKKGAVLLFRTPGSRTGTSAGETASIAAG